MRYNPFKQTILNMLTHTTESWPSWTQNTLPQAHNSQRKWKQTVVACETTLLVKNKRCWGLFKENSSSHLAPGLWSWCLSHKCWLTTRFYSGGPVGLASRLPCNGAACLIKIGQLALVSEALIELVWETN